MLASDLMRRALAVNRALLALGNEVFEAEGATFVRNRKRSRVYDANHVAGVSARTSSQIDRLLRYVEQDYAGSGHLRYDADDYTPPEFEARLASEGFERSDALVMLLEGELRGTPKSYDIQPIENDATWWQYAALQELDWREYRDRLGQPAEVLVGRNMAETRREKSPPVRFWMAYVDGEPRAYLCSWEGIEGVGQVENLFTHPAFRHRGFATALIHHCVADCRRFGAGPVIIVADPTDTPKEMYAAMGFRPVAVKRSWRKDLA